MRKFCIQIYESLNICCNHYLSDKFIKEKWCSYFFKKEYPLDYVSRRFDKPAIKCKSGTCIWKLDNKYHRVGNSALIWFDGLVGYFENGKFIK